MKHAQFLRFWFPHAVRGTSVLLIEWGQTEVLVQLGRANGRDFEIEFTDVDDVVAIRAEGMRVRSLQEVRGPAPPRRAFVFEGWDPRDCSTIEIVARAVRLRC